MRTRTVKALFFVALLSVFAADIEVGCGQEYVYGPVSQKLTGTEQAYLIMVNGTPYEVPPPFFLRVQVGDTVRFNGKEWSIVKPGETNVPISP